MDLRITGQVFRAPITAASAGTDITAVAAVPNKKIVPLHYCLSTDAAGSLTIKSGSTTIAGPLYLPASGGAIDESAFGLFKTNVGEALVISRSTTMAVGGYISYVLVDN